MSRRDPVEHLQQARASQADLERRLLTLVSASGTLLASPRLDAIIEGTLALARELVDVDGYAIWRADRYTGEWRAVGATGLSDAFRQEVATDAGEVAQLQLLKPLVINDITTSSVLERRRDTHLREGICGLIVVPLSIGGEPTGTLVFYSRRRRRFSVVEIETARAVANLAAAGMTIAELYEEQQRSRERSEFLVEASAALAASLDYAQTLSTVARLAVPRIADWCAVDMVGPGAALERLAVAHVDPAKVALAQEVQRRYADPGSPYSVETVVATGRPVLLPHISDEVLVAAASGNADRVALVRRLGLKSYMCVPLKLQERTVGAISFVSAESGRHFVEADLRFAEQVAARAALAVDSAMAYAEARDASRLKDEFLATLSHELRTPLNTLLGYARMLQSDVIAPDRRARAVDVIERNATTLSRIVGDVLDVSRIISGKLRLDVQPVDLGVVIREALETVRPAADAKQIRFALSFEALDNAVKADPARLQQVLWNLLSNAVKFTPNGGRIDISVNRLPDGVGVDVVDTGVGIAPDFLPYVFDRFRQADSRFSREHGGLGLGLAIARHIVEAHGGRITASSDGAGRGSTFRVVLPPSAAPAVADEPIRPPATRQRLDGLRVLAVDDQADMLAMVREILEAEGAHVTTAPGADEAIQLIEAAPPDVLLADIGMPGMDGLELIRRVRQSSVPAAQRVPAAALTAYARTEDRAAALESGYDRHLAKPVDPSEIVRVVGVLAGR